MPELPETYPRRILLAVTGLSPQIVTETLYALAVAASRAWLPTEVHLITTREGAQGARLLLLSEEPGWFARLLADWKLPPIAFSQDNIHTITGQDGSPLDDIRCEADNDAAADFICDTVRCLTADDDAALHVSLAGGRKTMGFYLGYALSLYARPQDRASHVLVSSPYESDPEFFYPTPDTRVLARNHGQAVDAKDAKVTLANIPFVRLREGLPEALIEGRAGFSATVAAAQKAFAAPVLALDLGSGAVTAGGAEVEMSPADRAFYILIARASAEGRSLRWDDDGLGQDYLREYARLVKPASGRYEEAEKRLDDDLLDGWFEERKSKCNRALRDALGAAGARAYAIQGFGPRSRTRFGLALASDAIHILDGLPGDDTSL